jgi:gamma-glutamylcyclotransferase (GGCT)/AIG2-like uncharacterized protein YtfP
MLNYFAYGSNMSIKRLSTRIREFIPVGIGSIERYKLTFHKASKDGSAKADCYFTNNLSDIIWGVIYSIPEDQIAKLDKAEGYKSGYDKKEIVVQMIDNTTLDVFTYFATAIDDMLHPFDWYKFHVLHGAKENSLPAWYIQQIQKIKTIPTTDTIKRIEELKIYSKEELSYFGLSL